ncbi:MAG TPA: division/cell wall cluster transcriptional repressor MraZ [Polyangiales bacterium]|nr:division/cell wall cluster transcriptional repressor MraZ [Polyangiales bacterium]
MFRGRHEHSIDAKGRTSLPARFRDVLTTRGESCVVITSSLEGSFLDAYPMREWEAFETKLAANGQFDPRLDYVRRHYVGNAIECDVDKLGRLILPSGLRGYAGLEDAVLWVGVGTRIELWQPARFLTSNGVAQPENIAEAKARLTELGL